jgi:hypothetical protein
MMTHDKSNDSHTEDTSINNSNGDAYHTRKDWTAEEEHAVKYIKRILLLDNLC